jgi:hypothetical protein
VNIEIYYSKNLYLAPLIILSSKKVTRKRRETTTRERTSVIEKTAEGKSCREIAEIAGIPKLQTADIMKEWQQHNIVKEKNRKRDTFV